MKAKLIVALVIVSLASTAMAADFTWDGATSGSAEWMTATNWNPDQVPQTYPDHAIINSTLTGDRNINYGSALVPKQVLWTANGTYVDKITLGAQFGLYDTHTAGQWSNTSGDATKMVLDLNGNDFKPGGGLNVPAMTITDSAGGGVFEISGGLGTVAGTYVDANTEVRIVFNTVSVAAGSVWHPDSLLTIEPTTFQEITSYQGGTVGNLDINRGELINIMPNVLGDVYIAGNGAGLDIYGPSALMKVGGDWTDLNTTLGDDYRKYDGTAGGRIRFEGASPTTHNVSIGRTLQGTRFELEDDGTIILGNDLISTYVLGVPESNAGARTTWDVGPYDLYISDMIMTPSGVDAQTFIMEAGADTGTITFDEVIHGTDWNVIVENGGGFAFGSDLVLMTINDLDTGFGTNLPGVTLPGGWSYDSLDEIAIGTSGSIFQLTNVVPEPVSLVLLGLGSVALLRRRR